ncbi:hypothetical protein FEM54_16705 [Pseudomonas edaphica]|uniref:Uncharacterized protein n=1 Tax=Pseudomonas edaphica TaxID=2006980 RepID=A0ABY2U3N7_9PSED|nr:hypothetical protein [Pseudomonas edaphica]TLG90646.1 hypothetical protein FEM54_16705 [Pseudomonas edaphica]
MMKLSNPKKLLDLDSFLPSDGETRFDMSYSDGVLNLDIFYEVEGFDLGEAKKSIRFSRAKYFFKTPFPGYSFFTCLDDRDISLLNSLVEYEHSDMLDMEGKSSGGADCRHYRLFLHSTGVAIHVIAQSCEISNERQVV